MNLTFVSSHFGTWNDYKKISSVKLGKFSFQYLTKVIEECDLHSGPVILQPN